MAKPTLIIDTREQQPYEFSRFYDQFNSIERRTLKTGDYSLDGYTSRIAIERKSLSDCVNTLIHSWDRFKKELERMTTFEHAAIVIEANLKQVGTPYAFSAANPNSVIGRLQSIGLLYGVHVIYADNRIDAESYVANLLLKFHRYSAE